MNHGRILVVDDDREIVKAIAILLEQEGYEVFRAYDGMQALEVLAGKQIQLVLIDVMMPKLDGLSAVMKIRERQNIPIILLSAKSEETDKVLGLSIGADDYVAKPYNPRELAARVKSQLRRYTSLGDINASPAAGEIRNGRLRYCSQEHVLYADGEPVRLTATETKIMDLLMRNAGRIFPAEEIYRRVWEAESFASENTVMVHIRRIREKIELNPKEPEYLKVVWGIGYKMEKRKMAVSFGSFFLGVSLLLGNGAVFLRETLYAGSLQEAVVKVVEQDYQNTAPFRRHIQSRLSNFLAMATGGSIGGYFDDERVYYGEITYLEPEGDAAFEELGSYASGTAADREQRKEKNLARAKAFHEEIRRNKNLLYRIADGDKELYSNLDGTAWDAGSSAMPKGYNFRLDFNGEKVSIKKDGKEQDIYGDGYYRGSDQWYVPGYQNFLADESLKSVKITILAAADPVSYSYAAYGKEGFSQTGNRLYDLAQEVRMEHNSMRRAAAGLAAGAGLFAVYLCMRKEKRAADRWIAQFTGKLWFEVKLGILLLAVWTCGLPGYTASSVSGIFMQQVQDEAVTEAADDPYALEQAAAVAGESTSLAAEAFGNTDQFSLEWFEEPVRWTEVLLRSCSHPGFLLLLFWAAYLFGNDYFKNRGRFLDGFFRKLIQNVRTDTCKQPFAVQQLRRVLVPAAAGLSAAVIQMAVTGIGFTGFLNRTEIVCAQFLVLVLLLAVISRCLLHTKRQAGELDLLADQISAVQDGDYTEKESLSADSCLKPLSESLSQIRRGMDTAVKEQLKSERMKVELVANVSHDLKTPLTSIISYLAFLKQEEGLPEHVQDYIRILDQKAGRLNSMVQDVFSVSKAASGQLPVELKELDFGKLLRQTLADMQEQILSGMVTLKAEIPQEAVMIQADGTRLYRVFQNLIQNALQYSLEGSRIFVELKQENGYAAASVKNISRQELRAGADFTERFVRGDESRTDDGSGLGLSIAKSFTEACGGTFALETDADLFVVRVSFRVIR